MLKYKILLVFGLSLVAFPSKSQQKHVIEFIDTGFLFTNGHIQDGFAYFLPSVNVKIEDAFLKQDTLKGYLFSSSYDCDFVGKFIEVSPKLKKRMKRALIQSIDGDTLNYYYVAIRAKYQLYQLEPNNDNRILGLESFFEISGKPKLLINYFLYPISGECLNIKVLK